MAESLYIRIDSAGHYSGWRTTTPPQPVVYGDSAEALASALGTTGRALLLLPSQALLLTEVILPTRNRQKQLQALPYALEERLASDVDQLHFAVANRRSGEALPAVVVQREQLQAWLTSLQQAGFDISRALPDLQCLPVATPSDWQLLLEDEGALLRCGTHHGFGSQPSLLATLLPLAITEAAAPPTTLHLYDARHHPTSALPFDLPAELTLQHHPLSEGALPLFADPANQQDAIDLLQGEFSRQERVGRLLRPWRAAALLLGLLASLQIGSGYLQLAQLQQQDRQLQQAIEQHYRDTFPTARRIVDPRLQMERQLNALRSSGSSDQFVTLFAAAAPILQRQQGVELQSLRYKRDELELAITIADFQQLDRLKSALAAAPQLAIEIASASASGDRVESRLLVRRRSG